MLTKTKLTIKHTILNFKMFFKNSHNIVMLVIIIFCLSFFPVVFLPYWMVAGISYNMLILIVCSSIFLSINFNYKNSTLYNNIKLTKGNDRIEFYLSTMLTMVFVSVCCVTTLYCIYWIFSEMNILLFEALKFGKNSNSGDEYLFGIDIYVMICYATIISSVMTFAFSFFISEISNDHKVYFFIMLSTLILLVIFGGAFNDYFTQNKDSMYFIDDPIFPKSMYWFSLIFPYFSTGSLINEVVIFSCSTREWWSFANSAFEIINFNIASNVRWECLMFTPYIEIFILLITGIFISRVLKR